VPSVGAIRAIASSHTPVDVSASAFICAASVASLVVAAVARTLAAHAGSNAKVAPA
jgi:hypothetical protein